MNDRGCQASVSIMSSPGRGRLWSLRTHPVLTACSTDTVLKSAHAWERRPSEQRQPLGGGNLCLKSPVITSSRREEKESFYSVITIAVNSSPRHPLPASPRLFTGRRDPVFYILSTERFHHWLKARQRSWVSR